MIAARTIGEVQRAVAGGGRVRAIGTRHSFNDLADNGATLVSVTGIAPDPVIDEAAGTVTVGAGTSYGALAAWLQDRGRALANLGSLPHISIAGATATGTHGSGSGNRILSAAVAGLEYVAADGELLRRRTRATRTLTGCPSASGAFGIVVRVTLDTEPTLPGQAGRVHRAGVGPRARRRRRDHGRRLQREPVHRLERRVAARRVGQAPHRQCRRR